MSLINQALDIATNSRNTKWIAPLLLVADAGLCGVIIEKVACTRHHENTCSAIKTDNCQTPRSTGERMCSRLRSTSRVKETTKRLLAARARLCILARMSGSTSSCIGSQTRGRISRGHSTFSRLFILRRWPWCSSVTGKQRYVLPTCIRRLPILTVLSGSAVCLPIAHLVKAVA